MIKWTRPAREIFSQKERNPRSLRAVNIQKRKNRRNIFNSHWLILLFRNCWTMKRWEEFYVTLVSPIRNGRMNNKEKLCNRRTSICLNLEVLHWSSKSRQVPDDELAIQARCAELLCIGFVAADNCNPTDCVLMDVIQCCVIVQSGIAIERLEVTHCWNSAGFALLRLIELSIVDDVCSIEGVD